MAYTIKITDVEGMLSMKNKCLRIDGLQENDENLIQKISFSNE